MHPFLFSACLSVRAWSFWVNELKERMTVEKVFWSSNIAIIYILANVFVVNLTPILLLLII